MLRTTPGKRILLEITSNGKLTLEGGKIKFTKYSKIGNETKQQSFTFPIHEVLGIIIFSNRVSISKSVLELALRGRFVIVLKNSKDRYIFGYYEKPETIKNQVLLKINKELVLEISRELVFKRIYAMESVLKNIDIKNPKIEDYKLEASFSKYLTDLRSIEALATKEFYKELSSFFKNFGLNFSKRTRNPPKDVVNAMLSFGNMILYKYILIYVLQKGLNPNLGIFHRDNYNALIYDLSDPFKPLIVESSIIELVKNYEVSEGMFVNGKLISSLKNKFTTKIFNSIEKYEENIFNTINSLYYTITNYPNYKFFVDIK